MSLSMDMYETPYFKIKKENLPAALTAVKVFAQAKHPDNCEEVLSSSSLIEAMRCFAFELYENHSGDIDGIEFTDCKSREENELFYNLEAYIEDGSQLTFSVNGEYEKAFIFDGGKMTVTTEIIDDEEDESDE